MKKAVLIILLGLVQTACATAIRGVNEPFKVSTIPEGATVTTTLETQASKVARAEIPDTSPIYHGCSPTPCEFIVPRRSKFVARIEKDGFTPVQFVVKSKASLTGTATSASVPASVTVGGTIATTSATPGFLGLNTYLTGVSASGAMLLSAPVVAVDAASGSMLSIYPNPVRVRMTPVSESVSVNYDLNYLTNGNDTKDYASSVKMKKAQQNVEPDSK